MKSIITILINLLFLATSTYSQDFIKLSVGRPSIFMCTDSSIYLTSKYEDIDLISPNDYLRPFKFEELEGVVDFAAGIGFSLFLLKDGTVYTKGINTAGQQGLGYNSLSPSDTIPLHKIGALANIKKVYAAKQKAAAIDAEGNAWLWGKNSNLPVKLPLTNIIDMDINGPTILLIRNNGSLWFFANGEITSDSLHIINMPNIGPEIGEIIQVNQYNDFVNGRIYINCLDNKGNYYYFHETNTTPTLDLSVLNENVINIGLNCYQTDDGKVYAHNLLNFDYIHQTFTNFINVNNLEQLPLGNIELHKDYIIINDQSLYFLGYWANNANYGDFAACSYRKSNCSCSLDPCIESPPESVVLDTIVIPNSDVYLNASRSTGNLYSWQPIEGVTNPTSQFTMIHVDTSKTYLVNLYDSLGCIYKKEIFNLNLRICDTTIIQDYVLDTVLIPNTDIMLNSSESTGNLYSWEPINGVSDPTSQSTLVHIDSSIVYFTNLYDTLECVYQKEVFNLKVRDCDTIITEEYYLMLDTTIYKGDIISLRASSSYSTYTWTSNPGLSCTNCQVANFLCENDATLLVTLYNDWNCPYTEAFNIRAMKMHCPDIFTPNGDGYNDYFVIENLKENTSLTVFDRQGKMVYNNANYQNTWDGTNNNGKLLAQDNYFYVLKVLDDVQEEIGQVFIKRE